MTFEQKNENAANATQGSFAFGIGGGRSAFQNFLTGNADGLCGNACTYSEAQNDVTVHRRFNRYEMFVQDSWRPRGNVTVDYGVRYSLYPPVTDKDNVLTNFSPALYVPANAPRCATTACTTIMLGTGDPLNGIVVAGKSSPYGNAVYTFDKSNVQPRVGVTWDYVYMLPFFKASTNAALKAVLSGWQFAGITTINSGQPVSRISESTNGFLRGGRPNLVGDPGAGKQTANLYWFNPNAYAPAADGTFGNAVRAEWRQPGRNQTDLSLSKNWSFNGTQRVQFRADLINAFNHTQWLADANVAGLDNTCTISLTTCNPPTDTFGQILSSRAPREIQLGLTFYW